MKFILKDFQETIVQELTAKLGAAVSEYRSFKTEQAVMLSAPTGSGKTVVATAVIERILKGDADQDPNPDAVFLWITDQPQLNEQTRRKMQVTSSTLNGDRLVSIETCFDEPRLAPGKVYFLNTQKLAKTSTLVKVADSRQHLFWETVSRTIEEAGDNFFVIVDEAHRGMNEDADDPKAAATIIQRFIKGADGLMPPTPVVLGISATPKRFQQLLEGTSRTQRPTVVPVDKVRESGLLKDVVRMHHPTEKQPSDITMLRAAAQAWQQYTDKWKAYAAEQAAGGSGSNTDGEPVIVPVLVVQVEDGDGKRESKTDLAQVISAINDEVGPLPDDAFAHSFDKHAPLMLAERTVRYLAPADIDSDSDVQVVLFKSSLNTGWDCPRAEAMMSFRPASDSTSIAQLIGRMVRTPLARRVDDPDYDLLNRVTLYLPHYDAAGLRTVIRDLKAADPETTPPIDFELDSDFVTCRPDPALAECLTALAAVPTYEMPRATKIAQVRRLTRLAYHLNADGINDDAPDLADEALLNALKGEWTRYSTEHDVAALLSGGGTLNTRTVDLEYGTDATSEQRTSLVVSKENVQDLFEAAGRRLGESLAKAYWRSRVQNDKVDPDQAKMEVFLLAQDAVTRADVEAAAKSLCGRWLRDHRVAIDALPDVAKQRYKALRGLSDEPTETTIGPPSYMEARRHKTRLKQHLYVDENGDFPVTKPSTWETATLDAEKAQPGFLGWLRNIDRQEWSLRVPYVQGGETKALYPAFLIFRKTDSGVVVDLLDPHLESLEDAPPKAAGLAAFAQKHGSSFGRMELLRVHAGKIQRLDLLDETVRDNVKKVTTPEHLRQLFEAA